MLTWLRCGPVNAKWWDEMMRLRWGWVCECFDDWCEDYLHSIDLVKTTAQPTIDRVVLCWIAKLVEVLLMIEPRHPCPLDALRSMLPHCLQRAIRLFTHHLERVHIRAQPNEVTDRIAARMVLHLPHHRFVRTEVRLVVGVGGVEDGEVEVLLHVDHVPAEIRRLVLIHQGVRVREELMRPLPILLDDVVVKSRDRLKEGSMINVVGRCPYHTTLSALAEVPVGRGCGCARTLHTLLLGKNSTRHNF